MKFLASHPGVRDLQADPGTHGEALWRDEGLGGSVHVKLRFVVAKKQSGCGGKPSGYGKAPNACERMLPRHAEWLRQRGSPTFCDGEPNLLTDQLLNKDQLVLREGLVAGQGPVLRIREYKDLIFVLRFREGLVAGKGPVAAGIPVAEE